MDQQSSMKVKVNVKQLNVDGYMDGGIIFGQTKGYYLTEEREEK